MDLKQLLTMLQGVSGPGSNGEYTAKCPAHDDQTASLTVREKPSEKDGKLRLYLKCHADCTQDAVMAALRIKPRDLIVNPDPPRRGAGKKSGGRKAAGGPDSGLLEADVPNRNPRQPETPSDTEKREEIEKRAEIAQRAAIAASC